MADLHMEALQNKHIWHDVIREAPVKLSAAAVAQAKDSQGMWDKGKGRKIQEQSLEVSRQM